MQFLILFSQKSSEVHCNDDDDDNANAHFGGIDTENWCPRSYKYQVIK